MVRIYQPKIYWHRGLNKYKKILITWALRYNNDAYETTLDINEHNVRVEGGGLN